MGVKIDCKKIEILDIKNMVFESLYQNMLNVIKEKHLSLSKDLQALIEELDQGGYGIGCDIADFIKNKKDAEIFAAITKDAIDLYKTEFPEINQDRKDRLERFYVELLKYAEELED
jgi:hypothetical protein